MTEHDRVPLLRLALTWGFALAGFGLFFPYGTWYLSRTLGFDGATVGLIMASMSLTGLLSQPLWGEIADRTGRRTRTLTLVSCGTAVGYALCTVPRSPLGAMACLAALSLFSSALTPNLWAVTIALLGPQRLTLIGRARVLGTLGFGVAVATFPYALATLPAWLEPWAGSDWTSSVHPDGAGARILFPLAALLSLCSALCASTLPRTGTVALRAAPGGLRLLLTSQPFLRVLLLAFLCFFFMQGPMVLFPLLVQGQGGGPGAIGFMWVLMLLIEVPLLVYFGSTVRRIGITRVVLLGILAGAVRWLVSGYCDNLQVVAAVQALHGVTVWGVLLGLPNMVDRVVPPTLRATAQSLLSTLGFGLGSMASNGISGLLVDASGPTAPARMAGLGAAALALCLPWLLGRHFLGEAVGPEDEDQLQR